MGCSGMFDGKDSGGLISQSLGRVVTEDKLTLFFVSDSFLSDGRMEDRPIPITIAPRGKLGA
jgi:hypothetical protein